MNLSEKEGGGGNITILSILMFLVLISLISIVAADNSKDNGLYNLGKSFFNVDILGLSGGVIWDFFRMLMVEAQSQENSFFDDYTVNITDNTNINQTSIVNVSWDGNSNYFPKVTEIDPSSSLGVDLVGLWHLNDNVVGAGQNVSDSSSNSNNGTLFGGVDCTVLGQLNTGCGFDGDGDYVTLPNANTILTNNRTFTIAVWFNPRDISAAAAGNQILYLPGALSGRFTGFAVGFNTRGYHCQPSSSGTDCNTIGTVETGKWYHFALTHNGTTYKGYFNGDLKNTIERDLSTFGSGAAIIGSSLLVDTSKYFNGTIDEVAIWNNRTLTEQEIQQLYQNSLISGKFNSINISMGVEFNALNATWLESNPGATEVSISSGGINWCSINNGEQITELTCNQLPNSSFIYSVNFNANTNLDWVNFTWSNICNKNGIRDGAELCDGSDLGGQDCITQNYPANGILSCTNLCVFNYTSCSKLPKFDNFDGLTTNFTEVTNISNVSIPIIEKTQFGMINFTGRILDFTQLDLDRFVNISDRLIGIGIDTTGFGMNRLNVSARLVFYNVNLNDPVVKKDGVDCNAPECTNISYDRSESKFYFDVSGFSIYTVGETFVAQPGDGDTGPGSGPGGRSRTRTTHCSDRIDNDFDGLVDLNDPGCESSYDDSEEDIRKCRGRWVCDEWGECVNGIQTRECFDFNNCGTEVKKPELEQVCEESIIIPPTIEKLGDLTPLEVKRRSIYFVIILIIIVILIIVEEILKRRRRNGIKSNHRRIYDLIKLAEDNMDKEKLAGNYYNQARRIFEGHFRKCDEKTMKYIRKELLDLHNKIKREYKKEKKINL